MMFRRAILLGALLIGHSAIAQVTLSGTDWHMDPAYEDEIAPFLMDSEDVAPGSTDIDELSSRSRDRKSRPGPTILFQNGTPTEVTKTEGIPAMLPVSIVILPGPNGGEIRRSSLKVRVKAGLFWKTITEEIEGLVVPIECTDDRCESLMLEDDFDMSSIGAGTYDFVVHIRDTNDNVAVSKKRVVLADG